VLNRCITDNKDKDTQENDYNYCITYNYEYLEDYREEDEDADYDSLFSWGSSVNSDKDDKPE